MSRENRPLLKNIFLDLDDTILDFSKAERIAVAKTMDELGVPCDDNLLDRYHVINAEHWKMLERGEITRDEVKVKRYEALFRELGVSAEAESAAKLYEKNLETGHYFIDGAEDLLKNLCDKYDLYIVSNGTARVQHSRIDSADIRRYFKGIFISEEMGTTKPSAEFFEQCFLEITRLGGNATADNTIIVGDSLTSDMAGGKNAEIATVWFNPAHLENTGDVAPDAEIHSLYELYDFLDTYSDGKLSSETPKGKKSMLKKALVTLLCVILFVLLVVGAYAVYLFTSYYRVGDVPELDIGNSTESSDAGDSQELMINTEYKAVSFNMGFGAYEPDYSFFMDGGTESKAFSKERLLSNMEGITEFLSSQDADLLFIQEVDEDGTRTYHVNERSMLTDTLSAYENVWAQNWDCPYLFYPLTDHHGKNLAGILTFSRVNISNARRVSLPVEDGFMKIVDLDRCYSASYIPVSSGKQLVVYNVHLSAYTSDGKIAETQIEMLARDMAAEYAKGNYVICGGDFNKDLTGNSEAVFGVSAEGYNWAQPFPNALLYDTGLSLVIPLNEDNPIPTCRNADAPYSESQFVLTVDGFIVSDNVSVKSTDVFDTGFKYSDHNPIYMTFELL